MITSAPCAEALAKYCAKAELARWWLGSPNQPGRLDRKILRRWS